MSQKDNMFTTKLVKSGKKLVHVNSGDLILYRNFIENMQEGQTADVFFDCNQDSGTLSQLAKIHKCIRELAKELGYTFDEMKLEIKKKSGFCTSKRIGNENYIFVRSFGDASVTDLGLAIQAIIEIGDVANINFR